MKNLFPPVTIAAFLCFGIIAIQLLWQKPEPRQVDERFYLVLAHDLYEFGVFTSATARGTGQSGEVPQPDNYIVPAYPALLAAIAVFDPEENALRPDDKGSIAKSINGKGYGDKGKLG